MYLHLFHSFLGIRRGRNGWMGMDLVLAYISVILYLILIFMFWGIGQDCIK